MKAKFKKHNNKWGVLIHTLPGEDLPQSGDTIAVEKSSGAVQEVILNKQVGRSIDGGVIYSLVTQRSQKSSKKIRFGRFCDLGTKEWNSFKRNINKLNGIVTNKIVECHVSRDYKARLIVRMYTQNGKTIILPYTELLRELP